MATFKTTDYSNFTASPKTMPPVARWGGKVRSMNGNFDITTAYATNDVLLLFRVPWDVRPLDFQMMWDDLGTTVTTDVGLYYADDVPTAFDVDEFASGLALGTAQATWLSIINEAAAADMDRIGEKLWEWAGETSRPTTYNSMVDVGLTFTSITTPLAATVAWNFTYAID